jgi:hypothetical protein
MGKDGVSGEDLALLGINIAGDLEYALHVCRPCEGDEHRERLTTNLQRAEAAPLLNEEQHD